MNKAKQYQLMAAQMESLLEGCDLPLPALANCSALLWESMTEINWAGFYLLKANVLYLGPFQGKTACTMIPVGRGVCGAAAKELKIQLVPDVHQFPGHIACDSASNSEIVLPLIVDDQLIGVMDIDSPICNRFDEEDAEGLQHVADALMRLVKWQNGLL